jgi:hypothetical protein
MFQATCAPGQRQLVEMTRGHEPQLPERPAVLGSPKRIPLGFEGYPTSLISSGIDKQINTAAISRGPTFTVRDTGSVTVEFSDIDLRPEQHLALPKVRLVVGAPEGTTLDCEWKATAGNVPRRPSGSFGLVGGPSTITFENLEADLATADDEDDD